MAETHDPSQPPSERAAVVFDPSQGGVLLSCEAMGTRFEVALHAGDPHALHAAGELALDEVRSLHSRLSVFDPGSVVSRINAAAPGEAIRIAGDIFQLLRTCRDVWLASDGRFDPTIGPLMRAWGFRSPSSSGQPDPVKLHNARASTGMGLLELNEADWSVRVLRPGVSLDFGAIAKGLALDTAVEVLQSEGVTSAFLHGGTSSIAAIGSPPGRSAWRVVIPSPPGSRFRRGLEIDLCDASLSVSAPHGRIAEGGWGHVIDPKSGAPVNGAALAAVLGPTGVLADAWSTATLVVGSRPGGLPGEYTSIVHGRDGWQVVGPGTALVRESASEA